MSVLFWVTGLSLFLYSCWALTREHQTEPLSLGFSWNRLDLVAIGTILIAALVLRVYKLESAPFALHNDEAVMGIKTLALIKNPTVKIYLFDEFSTTNLWYYILSGGIRLFGQTVAALRVPSAIIGTLTILPVYLMARLLFSQRIAIIATVLLATYHFHIHMSRLAVNNVTDPFFGTLIFSALIIGLRTKRREFLGLAGVLIGLSLHFYTGARLFIPLTLLMGMAWYIHHYRIQDVWTRPMIWLPAIIVLCGLLQTTVLLAQNIVLDPNFFSYTSAARGGE
ncbi:glycosyltransferase family 39 protein [Chloroflexi bacterium TSY]|nr:glycosyltransferase family 39 protein [Chloroflexi bacterium TSY]